MTRTAIAFTAGAAIGAVIAYAASTHLPISRSTQTTGIEAQSPPFGATQLEKSTADALASGNAFPSHESRTQFYQKIAVAEESELITRILDLAEQPNLPSRIHLAQVLLSRYAELDPGSAIEMSREFGFGRNLTASLYSVWARTDPNGALMALRHEPDQRLAIQAGGFVVRELGGDEDALAKVINSLPEGADHLQLRIDVIASQAASDPAAAIAQVLTFHSQTDRNRALQRLAHDLGKSAPEAAFSASSQIADQKAGMSFQSTLINQWAEMQPESLFDYLETNSLSIISISAGSNAWRTLAQIDPERLLSIGKNWPGQSGVYAQSLALTELSASSPITAINYVADQPPGQQRNQLLSAIAQGYAKNDVEAALAWAENLQPAPQGIYQSIISSIANTDIDRALDIALSLKNTNSRSEAMRSLAMQAGYRHENTEGVANRILEISDPSVRDQSMQMLGIAWAQTDTEAAMSWIANNVERIPQGTMRAFAQQIGQHNPTLAAAYTEQLPASQRASWIQQVANGYAKHDSAAAMKWIDQYRGEPGYEDAVSTVIVNSARHNPVSAAQYVSQNPNASNSADVASTVARHWALSDPRRAAGWAEGLSNEQARSNALSSVANQWATSEPDNAAHWALSLAKGETRDGAVSSVITGISNFGVPEDRLFNAIDGDRSRQQAAVNAAYRVLRFDKEAAERLVQDYVTDSDIKDKFESYRSRRGGR